MVEYIVCAGMVAVVALAGVRWLGKRVGAKVDRQAACVANLSCAAGEDAAALHGAAQLGHKGRGDGGVQLLRASIGQASAPLRALFAAPVAHAAELDDPPGAALLPAPAGGLDPKKVGVVLNDGVDGLPSAEQLATLGVTSVRISLNSDNFSGADANVQAWKDKLAGYHAAGIDVVVNLPQELAAGFPGRPEGWQWHNGRPLDDAWYAQLTSWKDQSYLPRVEKVVAELGPSVHAFEIWNEPDELANRPDYSPALPPAVYGQLLRDAWQKVQSGPDGPDGHKPLVTTAGLDSGQPSYIRDAAAATDGVLYADAIGLHPYGKQPNLPATDDQSLAHIVADYGGAVRTPSGEGPLPIYITEASQPSHDPEAIRAYVNDTAVVADQSSGVSKTYFFWRETSDGHPGLVEYGPSEPGGPVVPKPTPAFQHLAGLLGKPCAPSCTLP